MSGQANWNPEEPPREPKLPPLWLVILLAALLTLGGFKGLIWVARWIG